MILYIYIGNFRPSQLTDIFQRAQRAQPPAREDDLRRSTGRCLFQKPCCFPCRKKQSTEQFKITLWLIIITVVTNNNNNNNNSNIHTYMYI